jgi:RecA-family ATPase
VGLRVESPGWTLIVTAEDHRERFLARLREIMATMDLTPQERVAAIRAVRVWDTTGLGLKFGTGPGRQHRVDRPR